MKPCILAIFLLLLLCGCQSSSSNVISLFNGKDLSNWVIENNGKFSVENGVIKVDKGTGWLRSVDRYSDYKLVIEFRFLEAKANSGIFVRTGATSKKDKNGWPDNGYQVQCLDSLQGKVPMATMIPYGAPPFKFVYSLATVKQVYKPVGEWQTYEITAKGEGFTVKLNGTLVTTVTEVKNLDGHIGIQAEHGLLEFRKIELLER